MASASAMITRSMVPYMHNLRYWSAMLGGEDSDGGRRSWEEVAVSTASELRASSRPVVLGG